MARQHPRMVNGTSALKLVAEDGELKVAGTLQEQIKPKHEPVKMPENISKYPVLVKLWEEIVPEIEAYGWLADVDAASLALMIRHYAISVKASNQILREGVTIEGEREEKKHPADVVFRSQSASFLTYARENGMTLQSRMRGRTAPMDSDTDNPFD